MHIESVAITGFRCYGPQTVIHLSSGLTAFVGANASGKTAALQALMRLFGVTRTLRTVVLSDFHVPPTETERPKSRALTIDVRLSLPELADGSATAAMVAPVFRHLRVERPGGTPLCRLRLRARWDDDGTAEGTVSQELSWIRTAEAIVRDDQALPVAPAERGLIQLFYTPASRDAAPQIRATTGALAARLLRAIEWSSGTQAAVNAATEQLASAFGGERAIQAISQALSQRWDALHKGDIDCAPELSLTSRRFNEVIAGIGVMFKRGPAGQDRGLEALSDGQQSLFYFALAAAVFDVERAAVAGRIDGFRSEELSVPSLTLFAVEEPENHVTPYYLARILMQIRSLVETGAGQAFVSSHAPSVLGRIPPEDVRYCRRHAASGMSTVQPIPTPASNVEAIKFVRNAFLAFPELYFARFVLLVEGDSERIVLPRLAEALDLLVDPSFVAIVPLGGRHVNHFWRLLKGLGIPYATLLDLDLGRDGGGFGRVKNVLQQLLAMGTSREQIMAIRGGAVLTDEQFATMDTWNVACLQGWLDHLQRSSSVFFSWPLDLDLAMLHAFPAAYAATIEGTGPRMTSEAAAQVVLGTAGTGLADYIGEAQPFSAHMATYRYHFLTHSKPATHLRALAHIDLPALRAGMPPVLRSVLQHIAAQVSKL
ncbi:MULTISPECIES: ATP-dependent endonuclease [unclassified Rubrivivax]|uniref:ATP-dependent nuclease n=1 Tax=unclassified Rubrivivax TaxID=2649762 RepID=UPI001E2E520E|nr:MULTISPECIES: TOPRIM nucleotidyl transferase/hydrolase domain-containing protein [unclassified Rubrivivax]MCC9597992.1 AAA family ATPase [Rubrivivax sp. JA1055]MCC9645751.1 AAA family ATPase [Rubrivivax sp. JA1029]